MTETIVTDPPPPLKPGERYVQIETDTFCAGCGYNLHSQPVTRDERLGIFICRCPECGKFHPAGTAITASRPWLSRFAAMLLVFWVLFVLHALFWVCMGLGATDYAAIELMTYRKFVASDGSDAEYANVPMGTGGATRYVPVKKGTTQPIVGGLHMVYTLKRPPPGGPWGQMNQPWWAPMLMAGIGAGIGLISGALIVIFLWHWPRRRYKWAMLLPFAVAAFMAAMYFFDESFDLIRPWAMGLTLAMAVLQAAFLLIGTLVGRKCARVMLNVFVPPQPRQHFNFLWRVDGKTPRPATVAQA